MKGPQSFLKHYCYILVLKLVGKLMGIYYYTLTCKLHIVLSVSSIT